MKNFFVILFVFASIIVNGAVSRTVNVTTAGTLSLLLNANEVNSITDLTVTGFIDARDIAFLRDNMQNLAVLNLTTAKIKAYTGIDGTFSGETITYPSNQLPLCSFYNANNLVANNTLTKITLPITITSIGGSAFCYCSALNGTFTIPASVKLIGDYALYGCTNLSEISVESNNPRYSSNNGILYNKNQDSLFMCPLSKTGNITIPQTVTYIGPSALESCSKLTGNLILPSSLKKIDSYAFYYCTGFSGSLNIPESVEVIGDYTFHGCEGFTGTINVSKNLNYFGIGAFFLCNNLSSYYVDGLNPYYSSLDDVLYNKSRDTLLICPGAKTGTFCIPNTVKTVGSYAFFNCNLLTENLSIPASVNHIGDFAFYGCTGISGFQVDPANPRYGSTDGLLTNNTQDSIFICPFSKSGKYSIPETVKAIDYLAFDGCINLTEIVFPVSLNSIGEYAFEYCTGLRTIYLPKYLTNIGSGAFYNCTALNEISIENPLPPSIDYYTFYAVNISNCYLYVPIGSGTYYRSAANWLSFFNIIESDFSSTQSLSEQKIRIIYINGELKIFGLNINDSIDIYSIKGIKLGSINAKSDNIVVFLPYQTLYLLKINNKVYKISN